MSGGGSGGQNTTTQVQQIPEYEQQFSQENQDIARGLGAQAYPKYNAPLIASQNPTQQAGQALAIQSGNNWAPGLSQAQATGAQGANQNIFMGAIGQANAQTGAALNPAAFNNYQGYAGRQLNTALNSANGAVTGAMAREGQAAGNAQALTDPNAVGRYMNPFVEQALAPQVQDLNLQLANQQQGINATAAQAGAFGDARQGAMGALQNLYGNQAMNQLLGTGYNNAYSQALSALGQAQNTQLGAAAQYGNMGQIGLGEQNAQLQGAQQYANLAGQQQQEQQIGLQGAGQYTQIAQAGTQQQAQMTQAAQMQAALAQQLQNQTLTGANATYNAGNQVQQQQQTELNAAYQQYLNQINWPYQMLNVREGALSNSPYNIQTATTLPNANSTAQGFGTLASAAGLLGGISGGGGGGGNAPFGGGKIQ